MSTKICKICEEELPLEDFYLQKQKSKDKMTSWDYYDCYCKKCRSAYQTKRRIDIKLKAIEYLGGECADCGLVDEPCVYDFHHLDPSKKDFTFGKSGGISLEKMKPELDKCILLCSNCHRKRHSSQF